MSEHKNYIDRFEWSWESFVDKHIFPHKKNIFAILSQKIKNDGEKDISNNKHKIGNRWNQAATLSSEIHKALSPVPKQNWLVDINEENMKIVEDLINMDYWTVSKVFNVISKRLLELKNINGSKKAYQISELFAKMREKSEKHTNIISRN